MEAKTAWRELTRKSQLLAQEAEMRAAQGPAGRNGVSGLSGGRFGSVPRGRCQHVVAR